MHKKRDTIQYQATLLDLEAKGTIAYINWGAVYPEK